MPTLVVPVPVNVADITFFGTGSPFKIRILISFCRSDMDQMQLRLRYNTRLAIKPVYCLFVFEIVLYMRYRYQQVNFPIYVPVPDGHR
jgi:hypothetical protein